MKYNYESILKLIDDFVLKNEIPRFKVNDMELDEDQINKLEVICLDNEIENKREVRVDKINGYLKRNFRVARRFNNEK